MSFSCLSCAGAARGFPEERVWRSSIVHHGINAFGADASVFLYLEYEEGSVYKRGRLLWKLHNFEIRNNTLCFADDEKLGHEVPLAGCEVVQAQRNPELILRRGAAKIDLVTQDQKRNLG